MDKAIVTQLAAFNQAYKEMEEIYHNYAKAHGLSDCAFWVLYSMWENEDIYPQRRLCEEWFYTPQTVNSALKSLEKQGLIELVFMPGNRKNKQIVFTFEGRKLAERVIEPLMQAENNSFCGLNEQERETLLAATQKHIQLLRKEISVTFELPL